MTMAEFFCAATWKEEKKREREREKKGTTIERIETKLATKTLSSPELKI